MLNQKYISKTSAVLRIIPSDEINIVISRGQRYSGEAWWWGDRANLWTEYAKQSEEPLSKDDAQLALSQVSGIPKRTLRYYADIAQFWEMEHREEYDPLPFSHFAVAKRYDEKCLEVLDHAMSHLEKYHKLPSAEYLEWYFSNQSKSTKETDAKLNIEAGELLFDSFEEVIFDSFVDTTPEDINQEPTASIGVARDWISKMDTAINAITQSIEPLPVSEESKENIREAIFKLHKAFEEAIKEISYTSQG